MNMGPLHMCRRILAFCVIVSVFVALSAEESNLEDCANVRENFKMFGNENLVPVKPVSGESLRVCTTPELSCCSRDSEAKYISAAEQYIREYLHSKTSHLGTAVASHIQEYTEALTNVMRHAETSLSNKMRDWYSMPVEEHQHPLTLLFTDLQDYVKQKNVVLENTINKFFDNIFPVMFKHVIYHQSAETWTHHYHHCLSNQLRAVSPNPFGKYPNDIVKKLTYGLSLMRTYLRALTVVVETVNTTNNLSWSDECIHAMTRMKFCSYCHGMVGVQPCYGLCYNVMNGCFARVAEIGREWQEMMKLIEALVLEMGEKSIDKVFKELLVGVSEAFMHAMVTATDYYGQVHDLCGVPYEASAEGSQKGPTFGRGSGDNPEVTTFPFMSVMQITLQLVDSKRTFLTLGLDRCPKKQDDPSEDIECWNGTEIAGYQGHMTERDILNQARNNPEVKVSLTLDLELRSLKASITETNFALQSHTRKTPKLKPSLEIADDPYVYDGSGSSKKGTINVQYGVTLDDDEDLTSYVSGSGSGEGGDGFDENVPTGPDGGNIEIVIPDGGQKLGPIYGDGGRLGPDIPPKQEVPPRHQNKGQPEGGAAHIHLSVTLFISTLMMSILFMRR